MKSSLNSGPEGKILIIPSVHSFRTFFHFGFHGVFFASKAKVAGKLMDKAWNQDEEHNSL